MDEVNPMINEDAGIEASTEKEAPQLRTEPPVFDPTAVITTKRRVQVKLTGERLMDPERGLPHLMKIGKKRIHISKNKSSFENLSNIVQVYQLWAHQLYPKAKFKDFIKLSQQLGRTDRVLREYRKSVIRKELGLEMVGEEEVNREIMENNDNIIRNNNGQDVIVQANSTENNDDDEIKSQPNRRNVFVPEDDSDDDDLDSFANSTTKPVEKGKLDNATEEEIQRLGTEQSNNRSSKDTNQVEDNFEEDEATMEAMKEKTPTEPNNRPSEIAVTTTAEDEIRQLEEEQLNHEIPIPATTTTTTTEHANEFAEEFEEDEDAMDAMREFDM